MRRRKGSLHLGHGRLVDFTGRVEYHARRQGLNIGINSSSIARHFLKQANSSKSLNG